MSGAAHSHGSGKVSFILKPDKSSLRLARVPCPLRPEKATPMSSAPRPSETLRPAIRAILAAAALISLTAAGVATAAVAHDAASPTPIRAIMR